MNPKSRHPQFIPAALTGVALGNIVKTKIGKSQQSAPMLIARPHLPKDHLHIGKVSPLMRLRAMQLMLIVYEASKLAKSRARMALRAV